MNLFSFGRQMYDTFRCEGGQFVETSCTDTLMSMTVKIDGDTYNLTMTKEVTEDD